jgi:hypothetical protein
MKVSTAPYVMFCDQDDVWLSEKIEVMLQSMRSIEGKAGISTPILIHSDLEVVDVDLKQISDSFFEHNSLNIHNVGLFHLLIRNNATGCSMLFNKALLEKALPISTHAIMHDWWLSLVAIATGEIHYIPSRLVKYRQHAGNKLGAASLKNTILKIFNFMKYKKNLNAISEQVYAFNEQFGNSIQDETQKEVISAFAILHRVSFFKKRSIIIKYGGYCQSFYKTCIMAIFA